MVLLARDARAVEIEVAELGFGHFLLMAARPVIMLVGKAGAVQSAHPALRSMVD